MKQYSGTVCTNSGEIHISSSSYVSERATADGIDVRFGPLYLLASPDEAEAIGKHLIAAADHYRAQQHAKFGEAR